MEIIISSVCTIIVSAISSFLTFIFTKRKYNTEVDHNSIENMDSSLEFYEKLSASHDRILEQVLDKYEKITESNIQLVSEVQNLKAQVCILTEVIRNEVGTDTSKYGIIINDDGTISRI